MISSSESGSDVIRLTSVEIPTKKDKNMLTVLVSAPYMIPIIDRYRPLLESYGIELILAPVEERLNEDELLALAGKFDGTLCGDDRYTERVLEACAPRLKVISKWGTGIIRSTSKPPPAWASWSAGRPMPSRCR